MLLAERQAPSSLSQLDYNDTVTSNLYQLLYTNDAHTTRRIDMPHVLLYGPAGSGKRVRVKAFLRKFSGSRSTDRCIQEIFRLQSTTSSSLASTTLLNANAPYGSNAHSLGSSSRTSSGGDSGGGDSGGRRGGGGKSRKLNSQKMVSVSGSTLAYNDNVITATLLNGPGYVEIILDNRTHNHKDLIQAILKYFSSGRQLSVGELQKKQRCDSADIFYKYIFIHGIDRLAPDAQLSLRRSMETHIAYCRLIMTTRNLSHVNAALQSRCVCLRNPAPRPATIVSLLKRGCAKYRNKSLHHSVSPEQLRMISTACEGNLTKAWLFLELSFWTVASKDFEMPWVVFLRTLLQQHIFAVRGQPQQRFNLHVIRKALYEVLSRGISVNTLFETIMNIVVEEVTHTPTCYTLLELLTTYALRSANGVDPIFHLEAWIQKSRLVVQSAQMDDY